MGFILWCAAGTAAFAIGRTLPHRSGATREALIALACAVIAGIAATAFDFGGWNELEPRAGFLAFFVGLASIALVRIATRA
ncbi:MAG: hypothetical protein ACYC7A_12635 [Thermoanaerobaculia bacterium]